MMGNFVETLTNVNDAINSFVWVRIGLILLLGTGLVTTIITKCFQITHLKHWWVKTIGSVFSKDTHDRKNIIRRMIIHRNNLKIMIITLRHNRNDLIINLFNRQLTSITRNHDTDQRTLFHFCTLCESPSLGQIFT